MIMYELSLYSAELLSYCQVGATKNVSLVSDPRLDELQSEMWAFENVGNLAKRDQLLKDYSLHVLAQAYWIQLPTPYVYNAWWPWVKNYHGENTVGYGSAHNWLGFTWLDQNLKKEMRGR